MSGQQHSSTAVCKKCGVVNDSSALFCTSCGTKLERTEAAPISSSSNHPIRNAMSRRTKLIYACIGSGLFFLFLFIFVRHLPGGDNPVIAAQPQIVVSDENKEAQIKPVPVSADV